RTPRCGRPPPRPWSTRGSPPPAGPRRRAAARLRGRAAAPSARSWRRVATAPAAHRRRPTWPCTPTTARRAPARRSTGPATRRPSSRAARRARARTPRTARARPTRRRRRRRCPGPRPPPRPTRTAARRRRGRRRTTRSPQTRAGGQARDARPIRCWTHCERARSRGERGEEGGGLVLEVQLRCRAEPPSRWRTGRPRQG
ncbi:unnamed protein product, partial [Prorocentrum cordatum]